MHQTPILLIDDIAFWLLQKADLSPLHIYEIWMECGITSPAKNIKYFNDKRKAGNQMI